MNDGSGANVSTARTYAGAGLVSIDTKGRMTLPSDIRDTLFASTTDRTVVISDHASLPCLIGFGENEQELKAEDIRFQWQRSVENQDEGFDADAVAAACYGLNFKANCEASGRFVLNPDLRILGDIENRAFIYGAGRHFCVWNPAIFLESDLGPQYRGLRRFLELQLKKEGLK